MSDPTKDKAMAAYMKQHNIVRTSANCPICHRLVNLDHLPAHLRQACGTYRTGEDKQ